MKQDWHRLKKIVGEQPIVHRYQKAVPAFNWVKARGDFEDKFSKPDNLTIVTVHNYDEKSLFEESLDYLGVEHTVLKVGGNWSISKKFKMLYEFGCDTEFLLYCDARDSVLIDDPEKLVPLFLEFNCGMVFNSTIYTGVIYKRYRGMFPLYRWNRKLFRTEQYDEKGRYLNAGAFIGKTRFVKRVLEAVLKYNLDCYVSDQGIIRGIQPWFHPELQVDYFNEIFYRN